MKILRTRTFSKKKSNEKLDKSEKHKSADGKLGAALVGAGVVGNTAAALKVIDLEKLYNGNIKMPKYLKPKQIDAEENKRLIEKLKTAAKKKGIKFGEADMLEMGGSPAGYAMGEKTVYMDSYARPGADILSHELGHAHYDSDKNAGKIGKYAHKAYKKLGGMASFTRHSPLAAVGAGVTSGIVKAKKEEKGKKEGKLNKVLPYLAPTTVAAPGLVSEVAASHKGLKMLKEAGAAKKDLRAARKNLASAALTYGTLAAMNAGLGGISKHVAYKAAKKVEEKKKEKKNKDKK